MMSHWNAFIFQFQGFSPAESSFTISSHTSLPIPDVYERLNRTENDDFVNFKFVGGGGVIPDPVLSGHTASCFITQ
jgi:hypothetical protein